MLAEIITGALVNVVTATGRWLATQALASHGKQRKEDVAIAEWFDTYRLSNRSPNLASLPLHMDTSALSMIVQSKEVQASLHELLASRLTDAPESDIDRVRTIFETSLDTASAAALNEEFKDDLFEYYDAEVCELVGRLQGGQPDVYRRVRQDAFSVRIIAVLNAIQNHAAALAGDIDPQSDARFLSSYQRHVQELHGKLQPPDFERRQRIPISDIYVSPTIVPVKDPRAVPSAFPEAVAAHATVRDGTSASLGPYPLSQTITLSDLAAQIDRTVLLGDPGGGKSTASNVLMYTYAISINERVPFLVVLRDFAAQSPPARSVLIHIEHKLETLYQCPPPQGLVSRLLLSGKAIVILDGLDELIDTSRRIEVTEIVEQFCMEYPLTPVLVTSRLVGYDQARLDDSQFACYRLAGFNTDQVQQYVQKWFAQDVGVERDAVDLWTESFMHESRSVPDLRSNPLMLALICVLYHGEGSMPRTRPEVYEQCSELLLRKWDAWRRINIELRAGRLIQPALRHLAYWMFTRSAAEPAVTERELVDETAAFLSQRGFEETEDAIDAARQFVHFCRGRAWVFSDTGTTATGETLYTFTHRTFLEYFAAAYLAITTDTPEALAQIILPHVAREEWEVVAELAVQKKDQINDRGAERAILAMSAERRRRGIEGRGNVLLFLVKCLSSIDISPQATRQLTHAVLAHYQAGGSNDRSCYAPVTELLSVPVDRRQVVREEMAAWAADLVAGSDHPARIAALRLVLYADAGIYGDTPPAEPPLELRQYWQEFTIEMHEMYRQLIIDEIGRDSSFTRLALSDELVSLKEVLSLRAGVFSELFESIPLGVFGISWSGYMSWVAGQALSGDPEVSDRVMQRLAELGQFLVEQEKAPCCTSNSADVSVSPAEFPDELSLPVEPLPLIGLLVILCILVEISIHRPGGDRVSEQFGRIPGFAPYLAARRPGTAVNLPSLVVPEKFKALFVAWAQGRVNFWRPERARQV